MLSAATKASANTTKELAGNDVLDAVRDTVEDAVREIKHDVKGRGGKISRFARQTGDRMKKSLDRTVDQTGRLGHQVEHEIKANPVRASAVALGAGFILGALLTRR